MRIIRKQIFSTILILLSFILISCSQFNSAKRFPAATTIANSQLPVGIQKIIYAEQVLLSRELNDDVIFSPKISTQNEYYLPENQNVFELKTYWIDEDELFAFKSDSVNPKTEGLLHREFQGRSQWRLIVHPESELFYKELVKKGTPAENFLATSTSSSRTLVIWPPKNPELVFFGKLSLDKEIAGARRTIPSFEVACSLGTSQMLDLISPNLPESFSYLPESIGIMPRGQEQGGMIIREIPEDIKNGKEIYVPLFSLYGKCKDCKKNQLLLDMINKSGMDPKRFIRDEIISPFLDQWLMLVKNEGISMEPHAQNVLMGLDENGMPNGKFLHRDLGGFNIDFKFREKAKLKVAKNLPVINNFAKDYHQHFSTNSIEQSLHVYFVNGFVFNIDKNMIDWADAGLIPKYQQGNSKTVFQNMVYEELAKKLGVSKNIDLRDDKIFAETIGRLRNRAIARFPIIEDCKTLLHRLLNH